MKAHLRTSTPVFLLSGHIPGFQKVTRFIHFNGNLICTERFYIVSIPKIQKSTVCCLNLRVCWIFVRLAHIQHDEGYNHPSSRSRICSYTQYMEYRYFWKSTLTLENWYKNKVKYSESKGMVWALHVSHLKTSGLLPATVIPLPLRKHLEAHHCFHSFRKDSLYLN